LAPDHTNLAGDALIPEADAGGCVADERSLILTIGHSTRPLEEFLDLLEQQGCRTVIDVRSLPRSRRYPQFNREALAAALAARGISYRHCASLGGLRHPSDPSVSVNRGLRNERFRAYADHMQTSEFADAVTRLVALAGVERCAVICAEALPWRCHRSLLSDALVARGCRVLHVIDRNRTDEHRLRKEAVVMDGTVSYPTDPEQQRLDL
jgi:uncharacterized protein (DUF488 family)